MLSITEFAFLLELLTSADNASRGEAEKRYEALRSHSEDIVLFHLLGTLSDGNMKTHIRKLAAVLLRRVLLQEENSVYFRLDNERKEQFRSALLRSLQNECDAALKNHFCNIIGELADLLLDNGDDEWPDLFPYIYQCVQSQVSTSRESGLVLLGMLAGHALPKIIQSSNIEGVVYLFSQCLVDDTSEGRVLISTIRTLAAFLAHVPQASLYESFQPLLPSLLSSIDLLIQGAQLRRWDEALPVLAVEVLIEIAEESTAYYESHLIPITDYFVKLLSSTHNTPLRHICIELLVTLTEQAPKRIRKLKPASYFVSAVFPIAVTMLQSLPEDSHWSSAIDAEEAVESVTDSDVAETALDRMCVALGYIGTWNIVSQQVSSLLQNSSGNWQALYAGLRYVGNYMEVSKNIADKNQLLKFISDMLHGITSFTSHAHPRVRASAYYALGMCFLSHGETIAAEQLQESLRIVLNGLPSSVNAPARVRRSVLSCLISIIDRVPAGLLESSVGDILQGLSNCLAEGPMIVQELCVAAIVSLAETVSGKLLASYYDALMPVLQQLLGHARRLGLDALWGQTIECCAIIGEVSGKQKFYSDALAMMNVLVAAQNELQEGCDERKYLLKAWVRIARCLEEEFLPFLPLILNQLLSAITQDVTVADASFEDMEMRSDIQMVEMEDGWVAVRSDAVEEQSSACQLVMLIVEKMQEHFYPHVEETVNSLSPLLDSAHEDVRSFAMVAMPELVRSTAKATSPDRGALSALAEFVIGRLLNAVQSEGDLDLIMTGLQTIKQTLIYCCTDWETMKPYDGREPPKPTPATALAILNTSQMQALLQCCIVVLRDSLQRRAVLRAEAQVAGGADEHDEADEAIFLQQSLELHYNIAELIGIIFRTHGDSFSNVFFEMFHENVTTMAHPQCLKEDRQFAYFIICDVIEFGLSIGLAEKYYAECMHALLDGTITSSPSLRQTCAYALGVAAEKYGAAFAPYAPDALTALAQCVAMGEDPDEPRGQCTDNAVAAVGIILEAMENGGIDMNYPFMWEQWLNYLPLKHDTEEGCKVIRQLISLMVSKRRSLLSIDGAAVRAISVLLEVLENDMVGSDLRQDVIQAIQLMRINSSSYGGGLAAHVTIPSFVTTFSKYVEKDTSRPYMSSSPQTNAPIQDLLMRSHK